MLLVTNDKGLVEFALATNLPSSVGMHASHAVVHLEFICPIHSNNCVAMAGMWVRAVAVVQPARVCMHERANLVSNYIFHGRNYYCYQQ